MISLQEPDEIGRAQFPSLLQIPASSFCVKVARNPGHVCQRNVEDS